MDRQYPSRGQRNGNGGESRLRRAEPLYDDESYPVRDRVNLDFGAAGRVHRGGRQYADSSVDDFSEDEESIYENSGRRDRFRGPKGSGRNFGSRAPTTLSTESDEDDFWSYDNLPTHRGASGRAGRGVSTVESSALGRESARRDHFRGSGRHLVSDYDDESDGESYHGRSRADSFRAPTNYRSGDRRANVIEISPSGLGSIDESSYIESEYEPRGMASGRGMGPNRYGHGAAADSDYDEESEYEPRGEFRGHDARNTGIGRRMSSRRPGRGYDTEDSIDDEFESDPHAVGHIYPRGSGRY